MLNKFPSMVDKLHQGHANDFRYIQNGFKLRMQSHSNVWISVYVLLIANMGIFYMNIYIFVSKTVSPNGSIILLWNRKNGRHSRVKKNVMASWMKSEVNVMYSARRLPNHLSKTITTTPIAHISFQVTKFSCSCSYSNAAPPQFCHAEFLGILLAGRK